MIEKNGQVMVDSSGADNAIFSKGYKNTFAVLSPATSYLATIVQAIASGAKPMPRTLAIISADDGSRRPPPKAGPARPRSRA